MDIRIEYCVVWNYKPRAAGLAAEIEEEFGARADLVKGDRGVFDVYVDGHLLFSKYQTERFPEPGEVVRRIREMQE